ncbi:MAG TPA: lamin tail domain-containing protein [Dermatophilaceae bacterium]|jgi:predicted extracellular nuclease
MSAFSLRTCAAVIAPVLAISGALFTAAPAQAVSANVVISEVYGGGGNSGATLTNDFVELYNRSDAAVDVSGWVVQYYSASNPPEAIGTATNTATLTGSVAPHHTYLVQMAAQGGGTTPLPTPDVIGAAAMSGTNGRIDLRLADTTTVVDRVGYGSAGAFEGSPAPVLSNTTSATRNSPCVDTDNNATDFRATDPTPENSTVGIPGCAVPTPVDDPETIAQIQGTSHTSPYKGKLVNGVLGVVTAVGPNGYWIQSTTPDDGDIATSEGLFVFTNKAVITVVVGDDVSIDGSISEFRPGGGANLTTTELTGPKVTVLSSGNTLPAPVVLGVDRIAPQQVIEGANPLGVDNVEDLAALFRPTTDAIDFYESLEGMLATVRDAKVVGATKSFGEMTVIPGQNVDAIITPRGGVLYSGYDHPNAMRVQLDDALLQSGSMPLASVGDSIPGDTVGVIDYSFNNPKLEVTATPTLKLGGLQREITKPQSNNQLAVSTFNVENLAPGDPQTKFDRLAGQVVRNLQSPDILGLEEIQDNSGAAKDTTVDSTQTTDKLIAAIQAAGGPTYTARWVNPQDLTDGGAPGGNIRQVFFYRADRGVGFVDAPAGDATTAESLTMVDGKPHLALNPGRITPTNVAWKDSRKPLAAEFTFRDKTIFVIANHFASKGGDDPLFGQWQQPLRSSETQRHLQAQEVRSFLDQLLGADAQANVVVLGDINDFEFSTTIDLVVGSGPNAMVDLPRTLPVNERYSYVFEGNSQVLDQILVSKALTLAPPSAKYPAFDYDIVHANSEFHDQDSDHDPQVVRLAIRGGIG